MFIIVYIHIMEMFIMSMLHFAMRGELIHLVPWNYSPLIDIMPGVVLSVWGSSFGVVIAVDEGVGV